MADLRETEDVSKNNPWRKLSLEEKRSPRAKEEICFVWQKQ